MKISNAGGWRLDIKRFGYIRQSLDFFAIKWL